jgi:carboxylesterase
MNQHPAPPEFFSEPEHQPFNLGNGPAGTLLIHGFPGTPAEMRPLAERLAQNSYSARGILLPGFGPDIVKLPESGQKIWLAAAGAAWDEVRDKHSPAILIGYSMGAAIAIHLAVKRPPDALILLAPFWRMGSWQFHFLPLLKFLVPTVAPFKKADFDDPTVHEQLAAIAPGADLSNPETQQFFREEVQIPLKVLDEVRQLGQSAGRSAGKISAPVLILQGDEDVTVQPADTRQLARRFNGSVTLREVPGDHSFIRIDQNTPYDISHDILGFLEGISQGRDE